jgi:4-hydroxybenzoyl-CoA thioesterase
MPPFVFQMPVRFADVDHAGIVYYPRFFHFFHVTFEEYFRARMGGGAYLDLLERRRIGFPAVRSGCEYRAPLRFGDDLEVAMSIARLGNKSVTFRYRAIRKRGGEPDVVSAEGEVVVAITDLATFRAVPLPEDLRQQFLELVQEPG